MLNIGTYEGNVVQLKRPVVGNNVETTFDYKEIDKIQHIDINTEGKSGIDIYFTSGKLITRKDTINYNSWLKKHFKLIL